MKERLAASFDEADSVFCYAHNLGWDAGAALAPLAEKAHCYSDLGSLVADVVAEAKGGA